MFIHGDLNIYASQFCMANKFKQPCNFKIGSDKMSIEAKNRIVASHIYFPVFYIDDKTCSI